MPWLVVLGRGTWMRAGVRYEPGKYEVDDLTAAAAKNAPVGNLRVFDEEPEIFRDSDVGPLLPEHIRLGVTGGIQIVDPNVVAATEEEPREKYDFTCRFCPQGFPSNGALERHIEFHHSI